MDRRKSLKLIASGALAGGVLVSGCKPGEEKKQQEIANEPTFNLDRNRDELRHEKELLAKEKFFTTEEMAVITLLADMIIPKDDVSGSASEAKVPEFIEFIVKDMPSNQVPLRGGIRWLDMQCLKRYEKSFKDCSENQRVEIVEMIAYPAKAKREMKPGVAFFNKMRDLTATGFYTSEMGVKDIGYAGNKPNQWNGVPDEVLKQYSLAYSEKELKECVSFDKNPA